MFSIYLLRCSVNGKCYVGLTKQSPEKRFKQHVYNALVGRPGALYAAMRLHGVVCFSIEVLASGLSRDEACAAETRFIVERGTRPPEGYNLTAGGDGLRDYEATDAQRAALSATHKRRQQDPALRLRTSQALKGKAKSPEHVAKVAAALRGRTISQETRAKISASLRGQEQSEETKQKRRASLAGRKLSPEHAAMIGDRCRGVPKSEDHKRKISEALRKRERSPEELAAMASRASRLHKGVPKSEEWKAKMRGIWASKRAARGG